MGWLHLTLGKQATLQRGLLCAVILVCSCLLVLGSFIFGNSVVYNIMRDVL